MQIGEMCGVHGHTVGTWTKQFGIDFESIKKEFRFNTVKKAIESKGGKLLSDEYVGVFEKMLVECAEGHQWEVNYDGLVNSGSWCPSCGGRPPVTIDAAHKLAKSRGGKCLSDKYVNCESKLRWECEYGHRWRASYGKIRQGRWCPTCGRRKGVSIETAKSIAESRGGKCHTEVYTSSAVPMLWECAEGHQWEADLNSVKNSGTWCQICARKNVAEQLRGYTIDDMRDAAAARGGKCLSDEYVNRGALLSWECERGHRWESGYNNIAAGCWCPTCGRQSVADQLKGYTIDDMRDIAASRGGRCLSDEYVNASALLSWECGSGHRWKARYRNIANGSWCPTCARETNINESLFRDAMEEITGAKFPPIRPKWLVNEDGHRLEIDGFNKRLSMGFEYQGRQHFEYIEFFHGTRDGFEHRLSNDATKKRILEDRGIFMLYPTYELPKDEFEVYIMNHLEQMVGRDV
jgi:hypothetical protein